LRILGLLNILLKVKLGSHQITFRKAPYILFIAKSAEFRGTEKSPFVILSANGVELKSKMLRINYNLITRM
jgi:hypothetical protein